MVLKKIISGLYAIFPVILILFGNLGLERFFVFSGGYVALTIFGGIWLLALDGRSRRDYFLLILPVLFLAGLFGTVAAVSSVVLRLVIAGAASGLLFIYTMVFPKTPPWNLEESFAMAAAALGLVSLWAWNFFFLPPWYLFLFGGSVAGFLLIWQAARKFGQPSVPATVAGLVGAIILLESMWAALFWPTHFLTAAAASFTVFYLIYVLSSLYYSDRLTKKQVYFQTASAAFVMVLIILSSPWQPLR